MELDSLQIHLRFPEFPQISPPAYSSLSLSLSVFFYYHGSEEETGFCDFVARLFEEIAGSLGFVTGVERATTAPGGLEQPACVLVEFGSDFRNSQSVPRQDPVQ